MNDNPENYENYIISLESQALNYQDDILGDIAIELKKNSAFYNVWQKVNDLKTSSVEYEELKSTIELYKYAVISSPVYEEGVVYDKCSWYTLHYDINQ